MSVPGSRTPGHGAPPDPLDPLARLEALFDAGSPRPRREPAAVAGHERQALEERLAAEHEKVAGGIGRALEAGVVDVVVEPADTRRALARAIAEAAPARGAHANIPL
ncbi:hypothetical protein [Nonomuraea pusilla]|uniref:Uncharacterized protein n=1 Tax=Nonomuraea pusilla TaxID=46177 RepID=A0A1H8HIS5_9ACTN|nr:hypothetical protein SAMN05660976_07823 [Nonomuraea pusilla]